MYTAPISSPGALQNDPSSGAVIARQAIVDAQGKIIGHELFNRSRNHAAHTAASDMMLALTALSHAGVDELMGDALIFVNCTHESLMESHLLLLDPQRVVLEIPALGHTAAEEVKTRLPILQALHERGFRLAFTQTVLESAYSAWLPLADFIKLDLSVLPADQITVLARYAARQSGAQLIAEKIETAAQLELLSHLGVNLFQGYWLSRPQVMQARLIFPTQQSLEQFAHMLRNGASVQELACLAKQDAVLSFNLLRLLVTSGVQPAQGAVSVEHAIELLGNERLTCWVALLQNFRLTSEFTPPAAQNAVLFGRFMELLASAQNLPQSVSEQAFLVGVISQLGELLRMPVATVTGLLHTSETIREAVLSQSGYLGALLALVQSSEVGEDADLFKSAATLRLMPRQLMDARQLAMEWARIS